MSEMKKGEYRFFPNTEGASTQRTQTLKPYEMEMLTLLREIRDLLRKLNGLHV